MVIVVLPMCAPVMMCGLIVCGYLILNCSGAACAYADGRHGQRIEVRRFEALVDDVSVMM